MPRLFSLASFATLLILLGAARAAAQDDAEPPRPNIVVLLADDMGFSDLGCHGSEIDTPHLDRLASGGLRFTQFYNSGRCCPSRASLLTGLYAHQAGIGHMLGEVAPPAYTGELSRNAVTIPEVLRRVGYRTLMTGKWHLGWNDAGSPTARGFDRFYGTRGYVDSYFTVVPRTEVYLDGTEVIGVTEDPPNHLHPDREWYTTDVYTDYALHFLDETRRHGAQPFFLYLAYNAPHFPLHARAEDLEKYRGRYRDGGWDRVRPERFRRLRELGILDDSWALSARDVPAWDELSAAERDELDLKMALYAAIVDRLDHNVGRVVDWLEQHGELDDTLVVFLSDNGGANVGGTFGIDGHDAGVDNYAQWAREGGWSSSYGQGWANVSNTPFRMYKRYNHEGGISAPCIVHWPGGDVPAGAFTDQVAHIVDWLPTFAAVAGASYPEQQRGHDIQPAAGQNLVPALRGAEPKPRTLFWEHEGHRAVRVGPWKLVALRDGDWELYDMRADRSETRDLAAEHPERVAELRSRWEEWAEEVGVLPWSEFLRLRRAQRRNR